MSDLLVMPVCVFEKFPLFRSTAPIWRSGFDERLQVLNYGLCCLGIRELNLNSL